jgi:hypothetical protein
LAVRVAAAAPREPLRARAPVPGGTDSNRRDAVEGDDDSGDGFCAAARDPRYFDPVRAEDADDSVDEDAVVPAPSVASANATAGTDPVQAPTPNANTAAPAHFPFLNIVITRHRGRPKFTATLVTGQTVAMMSCQLPRLIAAAA